MPAVRTLALTVSHLDRSLALFQALDFRVQSERYARGSAFSAWSGMAGAEMRAVRLALGAEEVELREFVAPPGRGIPPDTQSNDQIFQHMAIVVRDMDQAFVRLRSAPGVELVSAAPETIPFSNPAAGGIRALYFKDPDHHNLELIWFPEGKGRQRWHAQQTGLFLGIDHSAIAVSDSARSAPFYESLGFVAAGHSLNEGAEQARLSGVPDARVQITGFSAESGPGVEFLDYLAPGVGRSAPSNTSVNDLWHWEIYVEVADLASAMDAVTTHGGASRSALDVSALEPGYRLSSLVRDPDGHCLQLLQR
ncbi:MAG TPA: VOC family protein [Polyangiaceae bacterium]